jgi:hypothetical protein
MAPLSVKVSKSAVVFVVQVPFTVWNERYSTIVARDALVAERGPRPLRSRKPSFTLNETFQIDRIAASVVLEVSGSVVLGAGSPGCSHPNRTGFCLHHGWHIPSGLPSRMKRTTTDVTAFE